MIRTPTVFILGAGASIPYGYPSGKDLVGDVLQCRGLAREHNPSRLQERLLGQDELLALNYAPDLIGQFRTELKKSQQQSVDAFLEHRPELMEVGKAAIAACLCRRENSDRLFANRDWYGWLLDRITADTPFPKLGLSLSKLAVVTFNYDRSLEHYLFTAMQSLYGKPAHEIAERLNGIPFIHVHGQLGLLPWQKPRPGFVGPDSPKATEYGDHTLAAVEMAAAGIKIISENMDNSDEFGEARQAMGNAERIGILGFGYHAVNMKRLQIPKGTDHYGTCYSMTAAEKQRIEADHRETLKLGEPANDALTFLRNTYSFQRD